MEAGKIVERGNVLEVFQSPKAEITQKFVSQVTETAGHKESISQMLEDYPNDQLIKLFFVGSKTEQPVISQLIREFNVDVNIVHGNISPTKSGPYGTLIVRIVGDTDHVAKAIQYLDVQGIKSEVINNAE